MIQEILFLQTFNLQTFSNINKLLRPRSTSQRLAPICKRLWKVRSSLWGLHSNPPRSISTSCISTRESCSAGPREGESLTAIGDVSHSSPGTRTPVCARHRQHVGWGKMNPSPVQVLGPPACSGLTPTHKGDSQNMEGCFYPHTRLWETILTLSNALLQFLQTKLTYEEAPRTEVIHKSGNSCTTDSILKYRNFWF